MSIFDDDLFYKKSLLEILSEAPDDEEEDTEESETDEESSDDSEKPPKEDASKGSFESSLDADLDAIFIDFETNARDAIVQQEGVKGSISMLYEEADIDEINIPDFASNVARLVKNYENLLDMESILVSRAEEFLEDRYGEDAKNKLTDELETVHDIEINDPDGLDDNMQVPLAIGAKSSEG